MTQAGNRPAAISEYPRQQIYLFGLSCYITAGMLRNDAELS